MTQEERLYKHASRFHQRTQFYPQGHGDSTETAALLAEAVAPHRQTEGRTVVRHDGITRPSSNKPTHAQVMACVAVLQRKFRGKI